MGVIKKSFGLLLILILIASCSNHNKTNDRLWELISSRHDVNITINRNIGNLRTAKFTGGVTMKETEGGGIVSFDNSGMGAVYCSWNIYVSFRKWLNSCPDINNKELGNNIDYAINKMNDFIVINSILPISKQDLENKSMNSILISDCNAEYYLVMANHIKSKSPKDFRSGMDEFLSVPRPPVMNPCL